MNHSLELVVSYAMKGHQVLEDCIGTLEEVFKFYYYSPKEYRHLRAVADTFGVIIDHFGDSSRYDGAPTNTEPGRPCTTTIQ